MILLVLLLVLVGCAGPTYLGQPDRDFRRDNYECKRASETFWAGSVMMALAAKYEANKRYAECMEVRGYERR
jgi:hypothetical protein